MTGIDLTDKPMNLTPLEAAERLRLSLRTLNNWRGLGRGPKYAKFGKRVLYPLAEIEAYERAQVRQNTMAPIYQEDRSHATIKKRR